MSEIMSELKKYRNMYFTLFHAVTTTVEALDLARSELRGTASAQKGQALEENIEYAIINLRKAQLKTEQIYMDD